MFSVLTCCFEPYAAQAATSCSPKLPAMPSIPHVALLRCCVLTIHISMPAAISRPSKHLWLGNMQLNVNQSALEAVFGNFGTLESVRIFPGKTYAFVNFANMEPAVEAMRCLDGQPLLSITGGAMQLALMVLHLPVLYHAVSGSASPCGAIQTAYDRKLFCSPAGQKPLLVRYQAGEGEAPEGPMASLLGSPARSTSPRIGGGLGILLGNGAGLQGSPPRSLTSPPGSSGLMTPQRAQVGHAGRQTRSPGRS